MPRDQATRNFLFVYANPGDVDWFDDAGWREVLGRVQVPPEAAFLVVMLGSRSPTRPTDRVWFDDVQLVKVED
jgi:hypothetical protein